MLIIVNFAIIILIMENNALTMNNVTALSEYETVLADPSFRLTAERLAMKCGVRSNLKGSRSLVDAIILYGTELCTGFCEIYRIIGDIRGLKSKSVMREIAYAISQAFDIVDRLSKMVGIHLKDSDIHSALVIAYLGKIFRHPDLDLYDDKDDSDDKDNYD